MSEECSVDVLKLDHDPPEEFGVCVCQSIDSGSGMYFCLRNIICYCHLSMLVWEIVLVVLQKDLKLYIFFDFWTQALLFISCEFGVYGPARNFHNVRDDSTDDGNWDYLPWYCRVHWALHSAALPSAILSCVVFWTQLYKNSHVVHFALGTFQPSMAILDFVLIAFPLRLLNLFYFVIFYIVYILFTVIYYECGGTGVKNSKSIYKLMNWGRAEKAILSVFVGLAIGLGAYLTFCFVSMAKAACRNRDWIN